MDRLRARSFVIAQCAVTAGLAWLVAQLVLGHRDPFFAPVAAIITLGLSFGQRIRRAVEVAIGVAVGVAVGDVFVQLFGTGVWQITVVAAVAMSLATLLGAGQLMIIQAGVQAAVIMGLAASYDQALGRWLDAVVGSGLALLVATVAPSTPIRKPLLVASGVVRQMAATLEAAVRALRHHDANAADAVLEQARAGENGLAELDTAAAEGLAVVRHSPFRQRQLGAVTRYAELADPLDHASRNLRVLARRCAVALWRGEEVPLHYLMLMDSLADVLRFMAAELGERRLPTAARERLIALAQASSHAPLQEAISAVVILAQVRSITADLLELTGVTYEEARDLIPEMD
jgi:uncharacterized membrane protein YgaE (UPF0421/DUF939 family)